ncbi:MAG: hypothetical protein HY506_00010 [Candidatus Yanofskybacteria bacterium]|nr:hypothetical protein [Candidatus Yanofskybacteria bacterium]
MNQKNKKTMSNVNKKLNKNGTSPRNSMDSNVGSGTGKWTKVSDLRPGMKIAVIRPRAEIELAFGTKGQVSASQQNGNFGSGTDDILWDEIVAINHIGRERVYDIEVEGTHNFVGNDIFAHNTYINNDLINISAVNLEVGDIVRPASGSQRFVIATMTDQNQVAGIVTATPATSDSASTSIAFSGQATVKVSAENGAVKVGDRLALSHSQPGVAIKATTAGMTIGIAMEDATADKVLTLVNVGYWAPSADSVFSSTASSSGMVTVSSSGSPTDVLATLANAVMTRVQSIWAFGDIITEGVKKTYFVAVSSLQSVTYGVSEAISNWGTRDITIANTADDATKSLFTGNSAQASDQSRLNLEQNGEYLATYGVDSTRGEIQLSGSSQIVAGEAKVYFDYSFSSIISDKAPIRVIVTPTSMMQGQLYTDSKSQYGFVIKELNAQDNGTFDWLVIARRKGYDTDVTAIPTSTPDISTESFGGETTPTPATAPSTDPTPTPETPLDLGAIDLGAKLLDLEGGVTPTATPNPDTASIPLDITPTPSPETTP